VQLVPGRFFNLNERKLLHQLNRLGYFLDADDVASITAKAMVDNYVDYAGPLAGYPAGLHVVNSRRVLVTEGVRPIAPKPGKTPRMDAFLGELLRDEAEAFIGWLKVAYETLEEGDFRPGQMLVLAGPAGCGKNFLQWLITQILGGRCANPFRYMTDQTPFNADLAKAEHLACGDVMASFDIRTRKRIAARIKELCVEPEMSVHAKGKDATLTMQTYRRLTVSLNHEPEHMLFVPPLDDDMMGKISLLRCYPAKLSPKRMDNQSHFLKELPAFVHQFKTWKLPARLADTRFGVRSFHDKELLFLCTDNSPQQQLLTVIDEVLFADQDGSPVWTGSAETLKVTLQDSRHSNTVSQLLSWSAATGTYLSRLATVFPDRFKMTRSQGKNRWTITAPKD